MQGALEEEKVKSFFRFEVDIQMTARKNDDNLSGADWEEEQPQQRRATGSSWGLSSSGVQREGDCASVCDVHGLNVTDPWTVCMTRPWTKHKAVNVAAGCLAT